MPIFRSLQGELLAWLLLHPGEEFTMTATAKQLGVRLNTLHDEATRLLQAGLLTSRPVGRARLLSANPAHPGTRALTELLEITFGPRPVVAREFAQLPGVTRVIIFGSWAARYHGITGPPPNDIDVLVLGEVDRGEVYAAADRAQARIGMQVNPVIRTAQMWDERADPLIKQIQASPHVEVLHTRDGEAA